MHVSPLGAVLISDWDSKVALFTDISNSILQFHSKDRLALVTEVVGKVKIRVRNASLIVYVWSVNATTH